jgi:hypothetical protein
MEIVMNKIAICVLVGAAAVATPALAHDTTTPYPTRGACEAGSAGMSNAENGWLVDTFPEVFDTIGEASSFLTKAWTCDRNASDGQYYITDHRQEILDSAWFARRNH